MHMNTKTSVPLQLSTPSLLIVFALGCLALGPMRQASAQCTEFISGLELPLGTALTNQGNLLVSESGTGAAGTGRISIVDPSGNTRPLLDGLPSALDDVGERSGPAGLFMHGRTLYVATGTGDAGVQGCFPGTTFPNPAGPSSPIFSSILAIHFSAHVERVTSGFTLTVANQQQLADGQTVTLINAGGDRITISLVANFPDYVPFPLPDCPDNVQLSNPYHLLALGEHLYVTDGGRNLVWDVNLLTRSFTELVHFPDIPNPTPVGPPFLQAVPTGIVSLRNQLLVTLFRGFPFPPETSTVELVNPQTASDTVLISGLRTAIDVLAVRNRGDIDYLVLQHTSGDVLLPPFTGPGLLLRFETPESQPTIIADCLTRPTSMTFDQRRNTIYVSEFGGRVVTIPFNLR
jgi:hypothetical protein